MNLIHMMPWIKHMAIVAYRVHSVIFAWPDAPSFFSSCRRGHALWSN